MTRARIGGPLGLPETGHRADPARAHRPIDRATLRCAAAELRQRGLLFRDIGQALDLSEAAVRDLLEHTP